MKALIVLVILFAAYYILKYIQVIFTNLSKKLKIARSVNKMLSLFVALTWLVLIFWSAFYLFNEKPYYNLVIICLIVVLIAFISWFFIKDFIAGFIFRAQNSYMEGDSVQFGEITGKIKSLFLTHIALYTKEGKVIKIPYSKLNAEIISQRTESKILEENSFVLKTGKKENVKSTENAIKNVLIASPWRIGNKQPNVKYMGENDTYYSFEIQVDTRNQDHLNHLMEILGKKFN